MKHPNQLGKYEIISVLGKGGMGTVYLGQDNVIQRRVALKAIRKDLLEDNGPDTIMRFQNEARAAGRLNHPGIVAIYDYGEDGDYAYIAMEYVDGCELRVLLREKVELPVADACGLLLQLLDALDYAHRAGVVHRDIKPSNVMITRAGRLKLADFGIARIDGSTLTRVGSTMGTPGYMAPEYFLQGTVDHRADIFSSGVVLYEMLTHERPFAGPSEAIVHRICNEPERKPSEVAPMLAPCFDPVVARALAKDPASRYQSAMEFADAIRRAHESVFASAASADVSESTIMVTAALMQEPKRVSVLHPPGTQPTPSLWRDETLRTIERHLAGYIGPVARLHVRKASAHATDFGQLCALLAENLDNDAARHSFLSEARRLGASAGLEVLSRPPATPGKTPRPLSGPQPTATLSPEVVDRAARALAYYVGPIANVLARKAAAHAGDEPHLYSLLAAHLADVDRDAFLNKAPHRKH